MSAPVEPGSHDAVHMTVAAVPIEGNVNLTTSEVWLAVKEECAALIGGTEGNRVAHAILGRLYRDSREAWDL